MSSQQMISGQRHDRLDEGSGRLLQVSSEQSTNDDGATQITVLQRMLSATTGSVLTSLLATPLDVVRVRLQSQSKQTTTPLASAAPPTASSFSPSSSTLNPALRFTNIANLGVTSCCREVFWANNVAAHCHAVAPSVSTASVGIMHTPAHVTNISAVNCAIEDTQRKSFNTTWDGMKKIARSEGITSLWRGLSPTLLMAVPANVIYFSGYDALRYSDTSPIRQYIPDAYTPLVAGSFARVFAAAVVSPIEMFRTRMQASSGRQQGIIQETLVGMKDMVASQGYTSLWRGFTLTMWRDVPFSGIYWWGYEAIRNQLTDMREERRGRSSSSTGSRTRSQSREQDGHAVTLVDSFIAGALSGSVASILTAPFDVGKTRQQVVMHANDMSSPKTGAAKGTAKGVAKGAAKNLLPEEMSMPRFLLHIFREEGLPGLFKGWIPRTMKVAPACAIMISSYELGKKFARENNGKRQER